MEEAVVLTGLAMFTLLAAVCSIIFNKIKLPPLIGYIIAGILMVNILFLYQDDVTQEAEEELISIMKDMGLVMLMFCIGLEINIKKLKKQGSFAMLVVAVQLPFMVIGGIIGGTLLGFDLTQSIVLGAILSGSSSAVVLAVMKTQHYLDKEHVEKLILVIIIEDIGQVIILSIITPLMVNYSTGMGGMDVNAIAILILKILAFMFASIFIGLKIVPKAINWISDNVSEEILTITSVGLAFGMALLASYAGLSMAIGAFLMGMMVASSRKVKEINIKIEPMRDLFMAIFFISIGAEIYPASMLLDNLSLIIIFWLLFSCLIIASVFLGFWLGNDTCRNGFLSATSLLAMGEFAFIISAEAYGYGVIDNSFYTSVIGAALLSMICLPIISRYTERAWDKSVEACPRRIYAACCSVNEARTRMYNHVGSASKKTQKTVFRSMTHAYINIFVIAIIEIAFYLLLPPLADWLSASFGGDVTLWRWFILLLNFFVLTLPTYYLINNVKFLDGVIIRGAKAVANWNAADKDPVTAYERFMKFLEINTRILILAIDILIILFVPNAVEIPWWIYGGIFALAIVIMGLALVGKRKANKEESE